MFPIKDKVTDIELIKASFRVGLSKKVKKHLELGFAQSSDVGERV
jgi:hypothetical protein